MADDFHGTLEWQVFEERIKRVFPDRPIVEIPNNDPIFHTMFDLDDRYRITGAEHLAVGYKPTEWTRTGEASTTTMAASWWRSPSIPISAIPGNGRTIRDIRKNFPTWESALA